MAATRDTPDDDNDGMLRISWWLVGALTSAVLFAGTSFAVHVEQRLGAHQDLLAVRGERITALERDVSALFTRVARLEERERAR